MMGRPYVTFPVASTMMTVKLRVILTMPPAERRKYAAHCRTNLNIYNNIHKIAIFFKVTVTHLTVLQLQSKHIYQDQPKSMKMHGAKSLTQLTVTVI